MTTPKHARTDQENQTGRQEQRKEETMNEVTTRNEDAKARLRARNANGKTKLGTFDTTAQARLRAWLDTPKRTLTSGIGNGQDTCSMGAINLALAHRITAKVPDCMSQVIGEWIVIVQDQMPHAMRNSTHWRTMLPLAAATGRTRETQRKAVLLQWLFDTVLPVAHEAAEAQGFGKAWKKLCEQRTVEAAREVHEATRHSWAQTIATYIGRCTEGSNANYECAQAACVIEVLMQVQAGFGKTAAKRTKERIWETFDPCTTLQKLIR